MIRVEDNLYNATFPQQKLPLSKKNERWQHDCVNYIIGEGNVVSGGMTKTRFGEMQTYYNLYNSIFDEKDFKRVTNPFKVEDGFPATPQDFNIIRPKIDLLIGEETKRPMNFRVVRTSQEAASELMEKEKEMLMQYIMAAITARMSPEEAQQFQQQMQSGEVMPPEAIAKYMQKDYKDVIENTAYHTLAYLKEKLSIYDKVKINSNDKCIPHILNLSVLGVKPEVMLHALESDEIYISTQSACSANNNISKSVMSLTNDKKRAESSIRISLSYLTTKEEIDLFLESFDKHYKKLTNLKGDL